MLVNWVATAASAIASLFGGSLGSASKSVNSLGNSLGSVNKGIDNLESGFGGVNKQAEKLKKLTTGFDELNVLNDNSAASGGGSGGGGASGVDIPKIDTSGLNFNLNLGNTKRDLEEVEQRLQGVLVVVGLVAAGIAAWKIMDFITNPAVSLSSTFKTIGGYALMIAGALLTILSYSDAWANCVDWGNLAVLIAGVAAVLTGLYLICVYC